MVPDEPGGPRHEDHLRALVLRGEESLVKFSSMSWVFCGRSDRRRAFPAEQCCRRLVHSISAGDRSAGLRAAGTLTGVHEAVIAALSSFALRGK